MVNGLDLDMLPGQVLYGNLSFLQESWIEFSETKIDYRLSGLQEFETW